MVVGRIFGPKRYPLVDIGQIEFGAETTKVQGVIPVAEHLMMHVFLLRGRHVQVKVSQLDAQGGVAAIDERGLGKFFQVQAARFRS